MEKTIAYLQKQGFKIAEKIESLKIKQSNQEDLRYFWDGNYFGLHISSDTFSDWETVILFLNNEATKTQILYLNGSFFDDLEISNTHFSELVYLHISDNKNVRQIAIRLQTSKLKELSITKCSSLKVLNIIGDFPDLEKVDCWSNSLNELFFNAQTPKLFYLNFSKNEISRLHLPQSFNLRYLFADSNQLKEISLQSCPHLTIVELQDNKIHRLQLPQNLSYLEVLKLNNNQLEKIVLNGDFSILGGFLCSNNRLNSVYLEGNFDNLKELDLSTNALSDIRFSTLPSLINLNLNKNQLKDKNVIRDIFEKCSALESIDLHENNTGISGDILSYCRPKEILEYLAEESKGLSKKHIFKIILIGNGCAGKTTLWHWLDQKKFVEIDEKKRTHGIIIEKWQHPNDDNFEFNVWDFAGQEIYHPMHRLFMTERTIYITLWATERPCSDYENQPLGYWIDYIADMSPKSYILSLQNLFKEQERKDLEELSAEMQNMYQANGINISELDAINLKTASEYDVEDVANKVWTTAKKIRGEIKEDVPQTWYNVAKVVEDKKKSVVRISKEEFYEICELNNITKGGEETLLNHLHHTGVLFYNKGCWDDEIILNQQSILTPIYQLLKGNLKSHLTWKDLEDKWVKENDQEIEFLIGFMERCGVLFKNYPDDKWWRDIKTAEFIIPQFLELKKNIKPSDYEKLYCWHFQAKYSFWHQSIFDKLLVRILKYADNTVDISRNFAEFEYDGVEVIFHTDKELKEANIYVRNGEDFKQKEVVELLRNDLNSLKKLSNAEEKYIDLITKKVIDRKEWESVSNKTLHKTMSSRKPKFFVSYANANVDFFDYFLEKLNIATKHIWEIWTDKNIPIGENWRRQIESAVQDCDFAILAVSSEFLASDFIKKDELAEFIKKVTEEKAEFKFFPFLLKPTLLSNSTDLDEFQELSNTQFYKSNGKKFNRMDKENQLIAFSELLKRDGGKFYADYDMDTNFVNGLIESIKNTIKTKE